MVMDGLSIQAVYIPISPLLSPAEISREACSL
jgi:hypothetical protein